MPISSDVFSYNAFAVQRYHRHRRIVPARDIGARVLASSQGNYAVRINVLVGLARMVQIHSLHPPRPYEAVHNRHAVSQIVRHHQHRPIRSHRQPRRIECRLSVVVILWRNFTRFAEDEEWSAHFRSRAWRSRLKRFRCFWIKTENPDFVLESSGNVDLETSMGTRGGRKSQADIRALGRRKIHVLNHQRRGAGIQVNDGNRLLSLVGVLAKLDTISAVHHQEIPALSIVAQRVRAAKHRHGHGANCRQMRGPVQHKRSRRRDGPPLSGGLLLAPRAPAEAQRKNKKNRHGSRCHGSAFPICKIPRSVMLQAAINLHASGRKEKWFCSLPLLCCPEVFFLAFMATHLPPNASTSRMSAAGPSVTTIHERVTNENKILLDRSTRFPAAGRGGSDRRRNREKSARRAGRDRQDQSCSLPARYRARLLRAGHGRHVRRGAQASSKDAHGNLRREPENHPCL